MTEGAIARKTESGKVPLIGTVSVSVKSLPGGWVTVFSEGDRVLASDESRTAPWLDSRALGRLTTVLKSALDREQMPIERKAIRGLIADWLKAMSEADKSERITSSSIVRVLEATESVMIERTEPPNFLIMVDGKEILFSNAEMASDSAKKLNERWLASFFEILGASAADWREIRAYWLSTAEQIDPWGDETVYDQAVAALQIRVSAETVFTDPEGLIRSGLYLEKCSAPANILWVRNTLITETVEDAGTGVTINGLSAHLRKERFLARPSTKKRVKGVLLRAWGFTESFRSEGDLPSVRVDTLGGCTDVP